MTDAWVGGAQTPGWDGFMHKAYFVGLAPSTRYYYRVGDGVTWSPEFHFRTAPEPGTGDGLRYLLFGDMGTIMPFGFAVTDEMVKVHAREPYDMTLHLGDVSYAGTGSTREFQIVWDLWGRQVEPLGAFFTYENSLGNHEKGWLSFLRRARAAAHAGAVHFGSP